MHQEQETNLISNFIAPRSQETVAKSNWSSADVRSFFENISILAHHDS